MIKDRYSQEQLKEKIAGIKHGIGFAILNDLTTIKFKSQDVGELKTFGIFGYFFSKDKQLLVWLRDNEFYLVKEFKAEKYLNFFTHHELSGLNKKLEDLIENESC